MDYLGVQALDTKTALRAAIRLLQQQTPSLLLTTLLPLPRATPYILQLIDLRLHPSLLVPHRSTRMGHSGTHPLHSVRPCPSLGLRADWLKRRQPVTPAPVVAAATPTTQALPSHLPSTICCS